MPARDEGQTCIVSRTLLRRTLADLEFYRGLVGGYASVDKVVLDMPGHPDDGRTIGERITGTAQHIAEIMAAGNITEDEDLDD